MLKTQKKLVVIGDQGVGKTQLINKLLGKSTKNIYVPTLGVECDKFQHETLNYDYVIWDCAGYGKYQGLKDGYYIGADICLIVTNDNLTSIPEYIKNIKRTTNNIPIILLYNHHSEVPKYELDRTYIDNVLITGDSGLLEPIQALDRLLQRNSC